MPKSTKKAAPESAAFFRLMNLWTGASQRSCTGACTRAFH
jgi:hypothetical protein